MKTKNLVRNFLFVLFLLASMAMNAQKIYVNRSNGLSSEFNIADIDSISFNPSTSSQAIELTSPITENTTLRNMGLPVDYYFSGSSLSVENNAILTIEPGVTIQFRNAGGYLYINDGATLKAIGTPEKHIKFIGSVEDKGSWRGIEIYTGWTADDRKNELNYVEILNAGGGNYAYGSLIVDNGGKVAVNNSVISNSSTNGVYITDNGSGTTYLLSFSNNTVSNCNKAPIFTGYFAGTNALQNMDNTNSFTGNTEDYIHIGNGQDGNVTFGNNMMLPNLNGYPWYFENGINLDFDQNFTVEAGSILIMGSNSRIYVPGTSHFIADGTAAARITIRGMRSEAGYWYGFQIYSLTVGTKLNFCDISDGGGETSCMANVYMGTGNAPGSNAYLEINNTTLSNSQRYGMHLYDYNYNDENCIISSSNPASVTFSGCQLGNIYSNCSGYTIYPDLSSSCNLGH